MRVSQKYAVMILSLMFTLYAVGACGVGDGGSIMSNSFTSLSNVQINTGENPPYVCGEESAQTLTDNGRIIYSSGTNVKYTYTSSLHLYKD